MNKESIERRILKIASIITAIGVVLFLALIPISYSLVIGWVVGAGSVLMTYSLSLLILKLLFKKKNFKHGMLVTTIRLISIYVIHISIIIAIIAIDKAYHGFGITGGTEISDVYKPINIFSYLGGVAVVAISTIIAGLPSKKGKSNERV